MPSFDEPQVSGLSPPANHPPPSCRISFHRAQHCRPFAPFIVVLSYRRHAPCADGRAGMRSARDDEGEQSNHSNDAGILHMATTVVTMAVVTLPFSLQGALWGGWAVTGRAGPASPASARWVCARTAPATLPLPVPTPTALQVGRCANLATAGKLCGSRITPKKRTSAVQLVYSARIWRIWRNISGWLGIERLLASRTAHSQLGASTHQLTFRSLELILPWYLAT